MNENVTQLFMHTINKPFLSDHITSVRNAFTVAHSSYTIYFKNTAFTATTAAVGIPASPHFVDTFPLLPPPLLSFSNSPLQYASKPKTIIEGDEDDDDKVIENSESLRCKTTSRGSRGKRGVVENDHNLDAPSPVSSPAPLVSMESWTKVLKRRRRSKKVRSPKRVENDEEEDVERSPKVEEVVAVPPPPVASESAHDVSKMLEATRLHYHSNFADNRGHINHSPRVMRVITWNRSFRGLLNVDDSKDDFDSEEHETHGTVLDKVLAWEKKLYDEVKVLKKLHCTNSEALEKAKVAEYIKALNNWLKLNLIPIENNLKEKVSSPPRIQRPPIQGLLLAWHDHLEKLPDDVARTAIHNFAAVINTIMIHQKEEIKMKEKCEDTRKELSLKARQFKDCNMVVEKQFAVETVKKGSEEEEESYKWLCFQVREKSITSLKTRLPKLFGVLSDFAYCCSEMYRSLRSKSPHNPSESSTRE
ncbi:hypothetical protein D8674_035126 [Pyrus ussuriensis x Pyrus communis]|uniref:DUF632 domain-containing protein n=1 Tax=Pyrus ussuriensis x Pyrus communis TaxID=2448454 RepID=A0A5N5GHH2_9ROSA|nr:hypothetical protein D8674_035126 [Pyrus ussuriensis x Pyrus communis]